MSFDPILSEYDERKSRALAMGGPERVKKIKDRGSLNARERIDHLFDAGTFIESGLFATSYRDEERETTPTDGKVCGYGRIDGREAAVVSHDLSVKGASSSLTNVKKMRHMREMAVKNGMPLVLFNESSGARIPDTMGAIGTGSLGQDPEQFVRRREVPYAAAVLGPAFGTACWFTQLSDFVAMRKGSVLAVSSPKVTSIAIKEKVDPEELGGWKLQTEVTGKVDYATETDEDAIDLIKKFLSYLPSHHNARPPVAAVPTGSDDACGNILDIVPAQRQKVYDMRKVIAAIADKDSLFELKPRFARAATTALARIDGQTVGFACSNPLFKAGALDPDGCDKITSFLVLCDSFNIPLVFLTDTPGFLIGLAGEVKKAPGKIMNFMTAMQLCSVPKFSIVMRKSYGQAYLNFAGTRNADEMIAWPSADIGFMDPNVAVNVVYGVTHEKEPDRFAQLLHEVSEGSSAYDLASVYSAQHVIDPRETRRTLQRLLQVHARERTGGISRHQLCNWPTTY
jgi:acetyl-CoA carboxylase carboxyltransferase component